jgi:hypothetical protein
MYWAFFWRGSIAAVPATAAADSKYFSPPREAGWMNNPARVFYGKME